jgi:hypothetical protein
VHTALRHYLFDMAKQISPKKMYAMQRMAAALRRAAAARPFGPATDRALRWAAAWGMAAGIRVRDSHLHLRRNTLIGVSA